VPIYTYKCEDCGEEFDLLIGVVADSDKLKCKKCSSRKLKRIFSGFGIGGNKSGGSSSCTTPT